MGYYQIGSVSLQRVTMHYVGQVADGVVEGDSCFLPSVPKTTFLRPRLLDRLTSWRDITVVYGPIGSGKTTLLASWASSLEAQVFWCEPDEGRLPFSDLESFVEANNGVLVIDQGERVEIDEFSRLGSLLDQTPNLRLVVATQKADTVLEIEAETNVAVDVIGPTDLLITLQELRDAGLLDNDVARLEALGRSEGLAVAVGARLDDALHRNSGSRERLRRKLRAELSEQEGRYEAALRIATLPRVDLRIIEEWGLSRDLANGLHEAGIADWDGVWLRLHPFIREVLVEDADAQIPPGERRHLITTAIRSSLIQRDPLQALRLAFEVGDLALASEVVFVSMVELLESRDATYDVFTGVAASKLRGYPALIVLLVLLSNMNLDTRPRALKLLATESLFQRLQPSRGLRRERVVYRAFEAAVLRLTPFSSGALPLIRRAVNDFVELTEEDMEALGRMGPLLQAHLGIGALYLGDTDLARRCFELADATHREAGRTDRVDPLSMRGGLAALCGELPLAKRLLAEADAAEWPAGWRESSPADFFNLGIAVLALEDGDPHAAQTSLEAAGPIVDIIEHWALFALVRARRDRLANEAEVGLMRLQQLRVRRNAAPTTAWARSLLDAAEAELLLAVGDAASARRIAAHSAKYSALCRIVLARAELALDRVSSAALQAQRVLKASPSPRNRLEAKLVLVSCALRSEHLGDAESIAYRIADLLETSGSSAPLRTVASRDRAAVTEVLLRAGIARSTVSLVGAETSVEDYLKSAAPLTGREQTVLESLIETGSLDEIASKLFVTRNTVKSQLRSVYRKLGVTSREAALTRGAVLGLIDQSEA